jgi:hypothetical protein
MMQKQISYIDVYGLMDTAGRRGSLSLPTIKDFVSSGATAL